MLNVVGMSVTAQEVYKVFAAQLRGQDGPDRIAYAVTVIDWLIAAMLDGAPEGDEDAEGDSSGNVEAPAS